MAKPRSKPQGVAKIGPHRKRWVRTDNIEFIHYEVPDGESEHGEGAREGWGETHSVSMIARRGNSYYLTINLSEMTSEELLAIKDFFNKVFDEAQEICQRRDTLAREAYESGDDSDYRLYRSVPAVVERERKGAQHGQGEGS
jgi:hypothetical protein